MTVNYFMYNVYNFLFFWNNVYVCVCIYIYMIDRITYMLLWYIIYHQNIFVFPFENTGFFRKYLLFCKYGVQMWLEDLPVDIAPIHHVWL